MKQRWLFSLCLALALLFAQQGGILHALSHLVENHSAPQEKHLPHSPICDECVAYAGVDSATVTASFFFALQQGIVVLAVVLFATLIPAAFRAYRSRAPPRSFLI
jgi:hypothetical protein